MLPWPLKLIERNFLAEWFVKSPINLSKVAKAKNAHIHIMKYLQHLRIIFASHFSPPNLKMCICKLGKAEQHDCFAGGKIWSRNNSCQGWIENCNDLIFRVFLLHRVTNTKCWQIQMELEIKCKLWARPPTTTRQSTSEKEKRMRLFYKYIWTTNK